MELQFSKAKLYAFYKLSRVKTIMDFYPILMFLGIIAGRPPFSIQLIALIIIHLLMLVSAFSINDINDAEDDARDPEKAKRNPVSAGKISIKEGYAFFIILNVVSLIISFFLGYTIFAVSLLILLLGYLYSVLPLRLKSRPLADLVSHGLFLASLQVLSFCLLTNAHLDKISIAICVGVFIFSVGGDLHNETRDWDVDRKAGLKNSASYLGYRNSKILGSILHLSGILTIVAATTVLLFVH